MMFRRVLLPHPDGAYDANELAVEGVKIDIAQGRERLALALERLEEAIRPNGVPRPVRFGVNRALSGACLVYFVHCQHRA